MPPPLSVSLVLQPPSLHSLPAHSKSRVAAAATARPHRGSSSSLTSCHAPALPSPLYHSTTPAPMNDTSPVRISPTCTTAAGAGATIAAGAGATIAAVQEQGTVSLATKSRMSTAMDTDYDHYLHHISTDPCSPGFMSDAVSSRSPLSTDRSLPCQSLRLPRSSSSHSDLASIPTSAQSGTVCFLNTILPTLHLCLEGKKKKKKKEQSLLRHMWDGLRADHLSSMSRHVTTATARKHRRVNLLLLYLKTNTWSHISLDFTTPH